MKKLKKVPKFKNADSEAEFWQKHDSAEYLDWSEAKLAKFPNLKPSTKTISLRIPESLLYDIKVLANKEDVPYQSLMKIILAQSVRQRSAADRKHHD